MSRTGCGRAFRSQVIGALLVLGGSVLGGGAASGQPVTAQDLAQFRAMLQHQQQQLDAQARQLQDQGRTLAEQHRLIEAQRRELRQLRAEERPGKPPPAPRVTAAAQAPAPAPAPPVPTTPARPSTAEAAVPVVGGEHSQAARRQQREQESRIVQSNIGMSRTSGVLTPRGTIVLEPSLEYDYLTQRQAVVSGFTIIPGFTFGNINIVKTQERIALEALTIRAGITDRLELNVRVPYVVAWGSTTTSPVLPNESSPVQPITADATGYSIGDIEFGGSYQLNSGENGWPVFVANLRFKTITGRDPFSVPIYLASEQGGFLRGIQKELPTGTGFYSIEPSLTVLYPTDPVILFGNIRYIHNFARTVDVPSDTGGASTPTNIHPGDGIGINFGMGFALNDTTSFSLGYEQVYVFRSTFGGQASGGSDYDLGTLTFGLGYQVSRNVSVNLGVGVGLTPDTPAAKILLSIPIKFNVF